MSEYGPDFVGLAGPEAGWEPAASYQNNPNHIWRVDEFRTSSPGGAAAAVPATATAEETSAG